MSGENTNERPYTALASDGDLIKDVSREEAFEWADEHLEMLEQLGPEERDHWVQINSYRPEWSNDE